MSEIPQFQVELNFTEDFEGPNLLPYLRSFDKSRPPLNRMFSWLLYFEVVSGPKKQWSDQVQELIDNYVKIRNGVKHDEIDPKRSKTLFSDLPRYENKFLKFCEEVSVEKCQKGDFIQMLRNVFLCLLFSDENFHYRQGFDRYCTIFLVLFFQVIDDFTIAEALVFALFPKFFRMIPGVDPVETQLNKEKIMACFDLYAPLVSRRIYEFDVDIDPIIFRYQVLFFSDEHNVVNIFAIWDQIFSRSSLLKKYLNAMSVSHFLQVPPNEEGELFTSDFLHFRDWNVDRLFCDADFLIEHCNENEEPQEPQSGFTKFIL